MPNHPSITGLGTRVAVRTFALFCLCAVVPIVLSAAFGYRIVSNKTHEQANSLLTQTSKSYGLLIFERLRETDEALSSLAWLYLRGAISMQSLRAIESPRFRIIEVTNETLMPLPHTLQKPASGDAVRIFLDGPHGNKVRLAVSRSEGSRHISITVEISDSFLWDVDAIALNTTQLCVVASGARTLKCVGDAVTDPQILSAQWSLYLPPRYGADPWVVKARQPVAVALEGLRDIRRTLPIMTLIAVTTALLLSVIQIRRSHHPLTVLTAAVKRIGRRRFNQRVAITTNDEYANLGRAFNRMSLGLSRQFRLLRTLSRIDRMILADPSAAALMERVLPELPHMLRMRAVAVALESGTGITLLVAHEETPAPLARIDLSNLSLAELAAIGTSPVLQTRVNDAQNGAAVLDATSVQTLPIEVEGKLRGLLLLDAQRHPLSATQHRHVRAFTQRFAVAMDSEQRRQALLRQAYYDELTGLPNRQLFKDRLERDLARARTCTAPVALIYIDLDRFKNVNDSLGHSAGDELLLAVSHRLSAQITPSDTLARLGGDEFVVITSNLDAVPAHVLAERLQLALREPIIVRGSSCFVCASIGITVFPRDADDPEALLRNADTAMYRAKAAGRGGIAYFEQTMNDDAQRRLHIEQRLRNALHEQTLQLFYQPKICLANGKLQGVEALMRWTDDELGVVPPAIFIPIAEECGLIEELGAWALRSACDTFQQLQRAGVHLGHVSVNASMRQFKQQFLLDVKHALAISGMAAQALEIEITESMLAENPQDVAAILSELRALGVRVAIDDFGTGYSSMSVLGLLPADVLKIDRSLITDCAARSEAASVVEAIISVAHVLGKTTVAEGVETMEQLAILRNLGCDSVQGYLFARPMPVEALSHIASQAAQWMGVIAEDQRLQSSAAARNAAA